MKETAPGARGYSILYPLWPSAQAEGRLENKGFTKKYNSPLKMPEKRQVTAAAINHGDMTSINQSHPKPFFLDVCVGSQSSSSQLSKVRSCVSSSRGRNIFKQNSGLVAHKI